MLRDVKVALLFFSVVASGHFTAVPSSAQNVEDHLRIAEARNWYVRVSSDSASLAEGRVRFNSPQHLRVGSVSVPLERIRQIERRSNIGGGWKLGAFLGAVPGTAFGVLLSGLCEYNCGAEGLKMGAIFGGIGAVVGGLAGELLHPPKHRWQHTWP